jgi:Branched-chain amino acid transport system / permease component/Asp/Glu/Hydantoin racemase
MVVCFAALWRLVNSRVGRLFAALKENKELASSMGLNVPMLRVLAYAISSFLGGVGGAIFVAIAQSVYPSRQPRQIRAFRALPEGARRRRAGARPRGAGLRGLPRDRSRGRALAADGAEAIVLGCAGVTDLARDFERKAGVPVLDDVACAVGLAEALARLGLRTSKRNAYAAPAHPRLRMTCV